MAGKKNKTRILFITPSLARTGSEVLLFEFIKYIAGNYQVALICYTKGALIVDLPSSVKVHVLQLEPAANFFQKIRRRFKQHIRAPLIFRKYKDYYWYINTMVLPSAVQFAVARHIKFILHAHELNKMYSLLSTVELRQAVSKPILLIANSHTTQQHLQQAGAAVPIAVIHPFIDLKQVSSFSKQNPLQQSDDKHWLMAGSIDQNKNPGLFVEIATEAMAQKLPFRFTWLYNNITDPDLFLSVQQKSKARNLPLEFIMTADYKAYLEQFSKADAFVLTSSSESFSLVTLEALTLSLALVITDCGGVREIVDASTASIVPLGSAASVYVSAMKHEAARYRTAVRQNTQATVAFDKHNILPAWEKLLVSAIGPGDNS